MQPGTSPSSDEHEDSASTADLPEEVEGELRALFDAACDGSPLTSVERALHSLAVDERPEFQLWYNYEVVGRFLQGQVPRVAPLFLLDTLPASVLVDRYLRSLTVRADQDPEIRLMCHLRWLVPLACHLSMTAAAAGMTNRSVQYLCGCPGIQLVPAAPLQVSPSDWLPFLQAFLIARFKGWVASTHKQPIRSDRIFPQSGVYAARDADRLACELLRMATPFSGPGGKVLVITCNDSASLPELNAADRAVSRSAPSDLRQALFEQIYGPRQARLIIRQVDPLILKSLGESNSRIARGWIRKGFLESNVSEDEASHESAIRMVRRELERLREAGIVVDHDTNPNDQETEKSGRLGRTE
jgi:hypothetical protein